MNADVECYAGSIYPERPKTFRWEGQRFEVVEILDRRREPEGVGFLVRCKPEDRLFDLFYSQTEDRWRIAPKGPGLIENSHHLLTENEGD